MHQDVHAAAVADVGQRLLDRVRVGEVAPGASGPCRRPPHRLDRVLGRAGALDARRARARRASAWPLAALPDALGQLALEAVAVGDEAVEVRVAGIGLGHEVEQVEGAARRAREVGRDRGDDAARRAGDDEDRVGA